MHDELWREIHFQRENHVPMPAMERLRLAAARAILKRHHKIRLWFAKGVDAKSLRRSLVSRGIDCYVKPDRWRHSSVVFALDLPS